MCQIRAKGLDIKQHKTAKIVQLKLEGAWRTAVCSTTVFFQLQLIFAAAVFLDLYRQFLLIAQFFSILIVHSFLAQAAQSFLAAHLCEFA